MSRQTRPSHSAPTITGCIDTSITQDMGNNIIITIIIILVLCTILKGSYILGHHKDLKRLS